MAKLKKWISERFKGPLIGFESPGYQLVWAHTEHYEQLAQMCPQDKSAALLEAIHSARDALQNRIWYLCPFPKYDLAWAELHQVRNELCQTAPLAHVVGDLLEETADELGYLQPGEATKRRAELQDLRCKFVVSLEQSPTEQAIALRSRLESLSQVAAQARETHWLKVNMTRNRLFIMGFGLLLVLGAALYALPTMGQGDNGSGWIYGLILLFGALGGLVSAIMNSEPVDTKASEYYIYRRLIYLRPFVGAALALVVYLAIRSKLLSIAGLDSHNPRDLSFLVVAFASGFAERAFVRRLLTIAGGGTEQSAGPPPATGQAEGA